MAIKIRHVLCSTSPVLALARRRTSPRRIHLIGHQLNSTTDLAETPWGPVEESVGNQHTVAQEGDIAQDEKPHL